MKSNLKFTFFKISETSSYIREKSGEKRNTFKMIEKVRHTYPISKGILQTFIPKNMHLLNTMLIHPYIHPQSKIKTINFNFSPSVKLHFTLNFYILSFNPKL